MSTNQALSLAVRAAQQQKADQASYDLSKKIPDMRCRGLRIETSYGEIEIDAEESQQITDMVERILCQRLARAEGTEKDGEAPDLLVALKDARKKLAWFVESYPSDLAVPESEFFKLIDLSIVAAEGVTA